MAQTVKPISVRFWKKVQKTETCWLWTGCVNRKGYGKIGSGMHFGKTLIASRVSWEIHNGQIPEGLFVCHKCDNPPCVNPEHLWLGTQADNLADMDKKSRRVKPDMRGEKNPRFGKHCSDETKRRIQNALAKPFQITAPDGTVINGVNLIKFARDNNLNIGQLSMLRRGICKTCKGFTNLVSH